MKMHHYKEPEIWDNEKAAGKGQLPLAVKMRPRSWEEFVGQRHIIGPQKLLWRIIEADRLTSLILFGPPGCGKTSLGEIISAKTNSVFLYLNANFLTAAEIKKELALARARRRRQGKKTVMFVDEIHRLNRRLQDLLIGDAENQDVILVGATAYNPFFYLNPALISRSLVFELKPLAVDEIKKIIRSAIKDKERGLGKMNIVLWPEAEEIFARYSEGDARKALAALEVGVFTTPPDKEGKISITASVAKECLQKKSIFYDRAGYHYDHASALIKSLRGSDVDSALYWLAKMLAGGEDVRFIARRLVILAAEDIGLADPFALVLANAAFQAAEAVGLPEAKIVLSEAVIYLAKAPKSNRAYLAIKKAEADVENNPTEPVPDALRDNHYQAAKRLGYGKDYKYPHNFGGYVKQSYRQRENKYYEE